MNGHKTDQSLSISTGALAHCLLMSVVLGIGNAAIAQTSDQPDADRRLQEIIVTATKREQLVQDVPLAVTALSETQLQVLGAQGFEDYARFVPNVSFVHRGENNRSFQPNIRGVQIGRGSPAVAFYIDETPLTPLDFSRIGLPDPTMFDIERIEVLKGPQGTLYGAASLGGAIKVVPNSPNLSEYEARLETDLSRVADGGPGWGVSGLVNIPVVAGQLALRVSGTIAETDGYIRGVEGATYVDLGIADGSSVVASGPTPPIEALEASSFGRFLNDTELFSVRVAAEWKVTDRLSVTPSAFIWSFNEGHGRQISGEAFDQSGGDLLTFPVFDGVEAPAQTESGLYNLKAVYDSEWGEVMASATFFDMGWNRDNPSAGLLAGSGVPAELLIEQASESVNVQDGDEEQAAFELRASTAGAGPLEVTGGIFYRELERRFVQFQPAPESFVPFLGTNLFDNERRRESLEEIAVFGEVTWNITDSVSATGGLRWSDYERSNLTTLTGFFATAPVDGTVSEDLVNYSGSVSWESSSSSTFYARVSDGFRTGFVALTDLPPICDQDLIDIGIMPGSGSSGVDADALTNYELGWKGRLFDNRLAINASAYVLDWEDVQIDVRLDCAFTINQNAGQAEIKGVELELQANPVDPWTFILNVGLADSELTEDAPELGGEVGEPLPEVSKWTVSGAIEYYPSLLESVDGYIRVDATYTDGSLYNFRTEDPRPRDIKEDLFLTNLRLGLHSGDWNVALYATNLFNVLERGQCRDTSFHIIGERSTCASVPRTIGIKVGKSFAL